jgi:hypothetical protein
MKPCAAAFLQAHAISGLSDHLCSRHLDLALARRRAEVALEFLDEAAHTVSTGRVDDAYTHIDRARHLAGQAVTTLTRHNDDWLDQEKTWP